jgi:hypothetical protein
MVRLFRSFALAGAALGPALGFATGAHAEGFSLNYADLSTLEEPLAIRSGATTLVLSGVVDGGARINFDTRGIIDPMPTGVIANGQATIETELGNRWTVGGSYFGQYDTYAQTYSANGAAFIRTSWGTLIGGNVGGVLREDTRRRRGSGNGVLSYDDFLGQNARWGGLYRLVSGPFISGIMVDQDGDVEVGTVYQRPYGTHDIRWSARARQAQMRDEKGNRRFLTYGASAMADLIYGSSIYDVGLGYERIKGLGLQLDRWFASAGARTKIHTLSMSLEGHIGAIDGSPEYAAAAGLGLALSRGLSANVGVNYREANVVRNGINVLVGKDQSAAFSMRYSY